MQKDNKYKDLFVTQKTTKAYELALDKGLTDQQAFVSAMAEMAQQTDASLELLRSELNIDYDLKIIVPKSSFLSEAHSFIDSETSAGSFAKDLLAGAIGVSLLTSPPCLEINT